MLVQFACLSGATQTHSYVRPQVLAEPEWRHEPKPEDYASEEFYLPVLEDDALLQFGELSMTSEFAVSDLHSTLEILQTLRPL